MNQNFYLNINIIQKDKLDIRIYDMKHTFNQKSTKHDPIA